MQTLLRFGRALAVPLSIGLILGAAAPVAFAKNGGLDDQTRPDDRGGSNSGSSSSGSGGSGSSGGSSGGSGSQASGGRDGYDREPSSPGSSVEQQFEQKWETSLDSRARNERDLGDRFR